MFKPVTQEQKPGNPHEYWAFRTSKNPNILSIDNQLIIKPRTGSGNRGLSNTTAL